MGHRARLRVFGELMKLKVTGCCLIFLWSFVASVVNADPLLIERSVRQAKLPGSNCGLTDDGYDEALKQDHNKFLFLKEASREVVNALRVDVQRQLVLTAVIVAKDRSIKTTDAAVNVLRQKSYASSLIHDTFSINGKTYNQVEIAWPDGDSPEDEEDDTFGVIFADQSLRIVAFNLADEIFCTPN